MNVTKSFGLGYKLKNANGKPPEFDVHINLWDIPSEDELSITPFIDFGIKIAKFNDIQDITFTIPFSINKSELSDLSYVLKGDEAQLIFNDITYKYEETPKKYKGITNGTEKMIFLPIKSALSGDYMSCVEECDTVSGTYGIRIGLDKYNWIPSDTTAVYFRFRIESPKVQETLLDTLKEKNYYLESAFVERQVIDIKFNDARNIDRNIITWYETEGFTFANFESIHLFVMVPSSYEITIWDNFSECRKLENSVWNSYLENKISTKNVMAYHWKKKASNSNNLDEFTQLIKIEHRATNWKIISIYCLIVILLGALGSGVCNLFGNLFRILFGA